MSTATNFDDNNYELQAALGRFARTRAFEKFGHGSFGTSKVTLWNRAENYIWGALETADNVRIFSNSGGDAPGGSGARKVLCRYLDEDWVEHTAIVEMAGSGDVWLPHPVIRINDLRVYESGSGGGPSAGRIDARTQNGDNIMSRLESGTYEQTNGFYSVPDKHQLIIKGFQVFGDAGATSATYTVWTRIRDNSAPTVLERLLTSNETGVHLNPTFWPIPYVVNAKDDFEMVVQASAAATEVSCRLFCVLVRSETHSEDRDLEFVGGGEVDPPDPCDPDNGDDDDDNGDDD